MKHMIWSNDYDTIREIAEDLRNENPDLSEDDALKSAYDLNDDYLSDELENLNVDVGSAIVVIADLGLWDGHHAACKTIGSNLKDCFSVSFGDDIDWFVEDGELKIRDVHHDGTNVYLFRTWKDGVTDSAKDLALYLFSHGMRDPGTLNVTTRPLGPDVMKIYGWSD